jgi:putative flippase GtrA
MKKLWNFAWGLYKKYEEGINYLIFGFAAFVLNMVLFYLFVNVMGAQELIGNVFSWIICVIFTYFTNRVFVFKSKNKDTASVRTEFAQFVGARLGTLLLEEAVILVGITLLHGNTMLVKLIGQILVIVSNYVLSKLWIFKEK